MIIFQIIIDHAPYRCLTGSGNSGDDFDRMLAVENIVYTILGRRNM